MKKITLIIMSLLFIVMAGCGYKEGVTTQEQASFLYFTGDAKGVEVSIDNASAFIVEKAGTEEHYKLSPGKHTIVVRRDGKVIVKRTLLLGDGIAREIKIPTDEGR